MTTNVDNNVPAKLTEQNMLDRAGANVTPNQVNFDLPTFDGTRGYATKPIESIEAYERAVREDYEVVELSERYKGYTFDEISVALAMCVKRFGKGASRITRRNAMDTPSTRTVITGVNLLTGEKSTMVVPDGATSLPYPFMGSNPYIQVAQQPNGVPVVHASIIRRDQGMLAGLFEFIRDFADSNSIYVNQAIDTQFNFLDYSSFDVNTVALTAKVESALRLHLINPLVCGEKGAANDKMGISPKTGIMFEGPPGGGKTVVSTRAIKTFLKHHVANKSKSKFGGTVIVVNPSHGIQGFMRAHAIANRLMSAGHMVMIVMEDMEKLAEEDRAAILEALDGGGVKGARRIIIGTTNFVEQIDRAMLREGRFSDVVHCGLPDLQAFEHLLNIMLTRKVDGKTVNLLADDVDFQAAWFGKPIDEHGLPVAGAEEMPFFDGFSFAFISGAVQNILRSAALSIGADGDISQVKVTTYDLQQAALSKRDHFEMMSLVPVVKEPELDGVFRGLVTETANHDVTDYSHISDLVREQTYDIVHDSRVILQTESGKPITGKIDADA